MNCVTVFRHPATVIVTGPSNSGKSTFVKNCILNSHCLVKTQEADGVGFDLIIVIYRIWNFLYDDLTNSLPPSMKIIFYKDKLDDNLEDIISGYSNPVLWIDDGFDEKNTNFVEDVFTRYSHHLNLSCFLVTHNLYSQKNNSCMRTISRNAGYIVLMNYPRDRIIARVLVQQCQSTRAKSSALLQTIERVLSNNPYSYFFFDFTQKTREELRFKTNIFCENESHPIVYIFKESESI